MALPVVGLYFLGVWSGRFVGEKAETFRFWKAWPLLISAAAFAAMLIYAAELNDWAAEIFGGDTSALTAPEKPGSGTGPDGK